MIPFNEYKPGTTGFKLVRHRFWNTTGPLQFTVISVERDERHTDALCLLVITNKNKIVKWGSYSATDGLDMYTIVQPKEQNDEHEGY